MAKRTSLSSNQSNRYYIPPETNSTSSLNSTDRRLIEILNEKQTSKDVSQAAQTRLVTPIVYTTYSLTNCNNYENHSLSEWMELGRTIDSENCISADLSDCSDENNDVDKKLLTPVSPISNEIIQAQVKKEIKQEIISNDQTLDNSKTITNTSKCNVVNKVYINIHNPWCLISVGIQGAGKTNTLNHIIENCTLKLKTISTNLLNKPMTALVCHYDTDINNYSETITIALHPDIGNDIVHVLVPPSVYKKRRIYYASLTKVLVHPLLFEFTSLKVEHLKKIMNFDSDNNVLYMHIITKTLRQYEKSGDTYTIDDLERKVVNECQLMKNQSYPLRQRLNLIRSFLFDATENEEIKKEATRFGTFLKDYTTLFQKSGTIVIADLSDPLMDKAEVCGIFNILVDQFITVTVTHGKLLVFDEVHKYLRKSNELSESIIFCARQMRHFGLRILLSTQNPDILPDELMELSTIGIFHQIFSPRWIKFIKQRFPISADFLKVLPNLIPGDAILFSPRSQFDPFVNPGSYSCCVKILPRAINTSCSKINV